MLKEINDSLGHEFGGKLIKDDAEILSSRIGKTDIFARIGGDEFCILLAKAYEIIASRISKQIIW